MNRIQSIRALLFGVVIAPCAFALTPAPAALALRTPVDFDQIDSVRPGTLTKSCLEPEVTTPCVAIPVAVTGVDETGEKRTIMTEYPVGPELIQEVKSDFDEVTDAVLRTLRPAIATGVKAKDHATRLACKQSVAAVDSTVRYRVSPGVRMSLKVEKTVSAIAKKAAAHIGKPILVTSGARTPTKQAEAMRTKIALGDNIVKLYSNKQAAKEVLWAYKSAKIGGASKQGVTQKMAEVIKTQMDNGVYLSDHLRDGAVDVRTRDLSSWQKKQLLSVAKQVPGVENVILETIPPHLHLEIGPL